MKKGSKKESRLDQDTDKVSSSPDQVIHESAPKPYEKALLQLSEARGVCGCDEDTMLAAAGDGKIAAYVMAQGWPAEGAAEPIWGYVLVKPEIVMLARNSDYMPLAEARLGPDGSAIKFVEAHKIARGSLYFSARDARRFAADNPQPVPEAPAVPATSEPGPRAERNLERTIAAMALLLAKIEPAQFMYAGKPNAEAIAKELVGLLDERRLADSGLSVRAIQERILAALKALAM